MQADVRVSVVVVVVFLYFYLWFTIVNYGLFSNTAVFCGVPDVS